MPGLPEYIYLGGAPHDMLRFQDSDLAIPGPGLRGCLTSFMLGNTVHCSTSSSSSRQLCRCVTVGRRRGRG